MRALILIIGAALAVAITASLTGCHNFGRYEHDMPKVQAFFMACMNASPPSPTPVDFENKVSACTRAAYASDPKRFVTL
jgi:hypothetical protein